MTISKSNLVAVLVSLLASQVVQGMVETYPDAHEGVLASDRYEVTIHQDGQSYPAFVYMSKAPDDDFAGSRFHIGRTIAWSNFSFTGTVWVEIKGKEGQTIKVDDSLIYPSRFGLKAEPAGENAIKFRLSRAGQYVFRPGENGFDHGLVIIADPPETSRPDTESPNTLVCKSIDRAWLEANIEGKSVLYFKNGVHDLEGEYVFPEHVQEIYLEGGSVVYGAFHFNHDNVKVYGRGTVSGARMEFRQDHQIESPADTKGIIVEGIMVADFNKFAIRLLGSHNAIHWCKTLGAWRYNHDGLVAWAHSTMEYCFIHADDDAIKIYDDNVAVNDCVIWHMQNGACLQLGWESLAAKNVSVRNIDIIRAEWLDEGMQSNIGVVNLRLPTGRGNLSENFLFENIYVDTPILKFLDLRMKRTERNDGGRHKIKDYVFRNIHVKMKELDTQNNYNFIIPWDEEWGFENVVFEDFYINGKKITEENKETDGRFRIDPLAEDDIVFK